MYMTRKEYMEKSNAHEEYYSQFVTDGTMDTLEPLKRRIIDSSNIHFNDIPLQEWDRLPYNGIDYKKLTRANKNLPENAETDLILASKSDYVCTYKAAASIIQRLNNPVIYFCATFRDGTKKDMTTHVKKENIEAYINEYFFINNKNQPIISVKIKDIKE